MSPIGVIIYRFNCSISQAHNSRRLLTAITTRQQALLNQAPVCRYCTLACISRQGPDQAARASTLDCGGLKTPCGFDAV